MRSCSMPGSCSSRSRATACRAPPRSCRSTTARTRSIRALLRSPQRAVTPAFRREDISLGTVSSTASAPFRACATRIPTMRSGTPGASSTTCSTPRPGSSIRGRTSARRRFFALGAAFDAQRDFHAYDADAFFDYPAGPGAVTAQFDYNRFDGGDTLTTLLKQNDVLVEAGYLIRSLKVTPVLQFAHRDITGRSLGDETRTGIGANYWWAGHNVNVKALYTR